VAAHDLFPVDPRPVEVRQMGIEIALFLVAQDMISVGIVE
jgi:hypothetical protein